MDREGLEQWKRFSKFMWLYPPNQFLRVGEIKEWKLNRRNGLIAAAISTFRFLLIIFSPHYELKASVLIHHLIFSGDAGCAGRDVFTVEWRRHVGRLVDTAVPVFRDSDCYCLWNSGILWTSSVCLWGGKERLLLSSQVSLLRSLHVQDSRWMSVGRVPVKQKLETKMWYSSIKTLPLSLGFFLGCEN